MLVLSFFFIPLCSYLTSMKDKRKEQIHITVQIQQLLLYSTMLYRQGGNTAGERNS